LVGKSDLLTLIINFNEFIMDGEQQPDAQPPAEGGDQQQQPAEEAQQQQMQESPEPSRPEPTPMQATGGLLSQQPLAAAAPVGGLDQIGEEGERLPEGYKPDGVISLEILHRFGFGF
jgi:hypothetical protein